MLIDLSKATVRGARRASFPADPRQSRLANARAGYSSSRSSYVYTYTSATSARLNVRMPDPSISRKRCLCCEPPKEPSYQELAPREPPSLGAFGVLVPGPHQAAPPTPLPTPQGHGNRDRNEKAQVLQVKGALEELPAMSTLESLHLEHCPLRPSQNAEKEPFFDPRPPKNVRNSRDLGPVRSYQDVAAAEPGPASAVSRLLWPEKST